MRPKKRKVVSIKCNVLVRYDAGQQKIISTNEEVELLSNLLCKNVDAGDVLCSKCRSGIVKSDAIQVLPSTSRSYKNPPYIDPVEVQSSLQSNISVSDDASQSTQPLQSSQQSSSESSSQSLNDPSYFVRERDQILREMIEMPFKKVVVTHKYCCVCRIQNKNISLFRSNLDCKFLLVREFLFLKTIVVVLNIS